ncbi:uncharacterized protein I303_105414 [Kwoniella dejecticola CBS 10117]|uniref:BZIP domain-containing protein n=1 Tax=Kwoniella dejecticola CBS 10117 TaxID=1296121 RepID=A0A1A6A2K7_9TREE|nr:uncharacterized protein I303_05140 [Kwoniella dejecticola CBS 10117]OBR84283.1 hypothetical protein I303_05140 [Kwoniella dejecticola CBS 10117]
MSNINHNHPPLSPSQLVKRRAVSPSASPSSSRSPPQLSPLSPEIDPHAYQSRANLPGPSTGTASVRRREANRLAAQRFRSRKKGYQDNLEERIRVLESEKEVLIRQLDESLSHSGHSSSSLPSRSSTVRRNHVDGGEGNEGHAWSGSAARRMSQSPEGTKPLDADVRIASLESANRRLQEDLRKLLDENEQMRNELRRWQAGAEDKAREGVPDHAATPDGHDFTSHTSVNSDSGNRTDHRLPALLNDQHSSDRRRLELDHATNPELIDRAHPRPNLPPLDLSMAHPPGLPTTSPFSRSAFETSESFSRSTQPDGHSAGVQLPPLRLPPIRTTLSPTSMTNTLPSPRGYPGGNPLDPR